MEWNKKKIAVRSQAIFQIIVVGYVALFVIGRKNDFIKSLLPDSSTSVIILIAATVILLATIRLWAGDFIKKPWREKNYSSFVMLLLLLVVLVFFIFRS